MIRSLLLKLKSEKALSQQIVKFIIAGGLSAALEFFVLIILVEYAKTFYLTANVLSFVSANILNYFLSRNWVFIKGRHSVSVEFLSFFLMASFGLLINQGIMWLLVDQFLLDYKLSKIFAIGAVVCWNFLTKKYLVFKG